MRILSVVKPTPEQLPILLHDKPGVLAIRGAAGSGKTTTALMRLRQLCATWVARKHRLQLDAPVRVLVLTYNRTLEGYVRYLAGEQVAPNSELELRVATFAAWAIDTLGWSPSQGVDSVAQEIAVRDELDTQFVLDELDYILGRFAHDDLEAYLGIEREGRGLAPRMDKVARRRFLDEVVLPYCELKAHRGLRDWNDLAVDLAAESDGPRWDVVIVDEAQDFSANQVRAVLAHLSEEHSVTFVLDAAQRIYPRSFTWGEVGVRPVGRRLNSNYRNTKEIAQFASGIVAGMAVGDDGALPNFESAKSHGELPVLLRGGFDAQTDWVIANVVEPAVLIGESVACLHPKGGGWFSRLSGKLDERDIDWVDLSRNRVWPEGDVAVALSTIHSAKGLEFDHVVVIGLNREVTPHGEDEGDAGFETLRRLLAMGVGRARKSVTLGCKPGFESSLVNAFVQGTYREVDL